MRVAEALINILKIEEGYRKKVYACSEGYPTVGYGIKIGGKDQDLSDFRHFPSIPEDLAEVWLRSHVMEVLGQMRSELDPRYMDRLDAVRHAVLASMVYQMGIAGVLKFKNTLRYISKCQFSLAADEMLDSQWAKQTPERALRHSQMMLTGELHDYYKEG